MKKRRNLRFLMLSLSIAALLMFAGAYKMYEKADVKGVMLYCGSALVLLAYGAIQFTLNNKRPQ